MANAKGETSERPPSAPVRNPWRFEFPNTADFNFNYWKLLNDASVTAIARAPNNADKFRVAIVGAGVAGLTAARELFRSGYKNIDIFESTDRIGGRTYSKPSALPDGVTTFEMGAMRLPFFWPYDSDLKPKGTGANSHNSVLSYYCNHFDISTQDFPNPGTTKLRTGIYMNRGRGPNPPPHQQPKLTLWEPARPGDPPEGFVDIHDKWNKFKAMFQGVCQAHYNDDEDWAAFWRQIAKCYWKLNFREFVYLGEKAAYDHRTAPGDFGGLGMDDIQARTFAVVGAGDGGWGAFYDVSCLYVLRTLLLGFGDGHQLIKGQLKNGIPRQDILQEIPEDSLGQSLSAPAYLGVQSLAECLFYEPGTLCSGTESDSLYAAMKRSRWTPSGVHLYTRNAVRSIHRSGQLLQIASDRKNGDYQAVVVTAPPWSLEVESAFDNFQPDVEMPHDVRHAMAYSHFITSCKVFYALKERYWDKSSIPQVIVTDTFLQGIYGMAVDEGQRNYPGVLLVSYTWEDDATKLVADDEAALAAQCLEQLDSILLRCVNIKEKISPYVNKQAPTVFRWERVPSYRGCARLYRQRSWNSDYALLTYNQRFSANSGLYFAGEAYSVEGGWVEPALRSALDAVIHLVNNTKGQFCNPFTFDIYPKYAEHPALTSKTLFGE